MRVLFIISTDDGETIHNAMRLANVGFQPGSVLCLRRDAEKKSWVVVWMLTPEIIS